MLASDESRTGTGLQQWSRRGFLIASLLTSACALARVPTERQPRVLFVCQYGTAKSAIAREVFRRRARERGIAVTAFSRGITLEDHVSPQLRTRLNSDGIDPGVEPARTLSESDWRHADLVIVFNPLPKDAKPRDLRDWTDLPSFNEDYDHARLVLDQRIEALLDEIQKGARE